MRAEGLALMLAACSAPDALCTRVTEALQQCGFTVEDLNCDGLSRGDLDQLATRFGTSDCEAFSSGARAVDSRICALGRWSCPDSPLPTPADAKPQNALVLVSGIDGTPIFDWNVDIATALQTAGIEIHHVSVLPWATTIERAKDLELSLRSLASHVRNSRMNLVCYAVGGLDCRYLASPAGLGASDLVASITTVATPHRGTRVAEAAQAALQNGSLNEVVQALAGSNTHIDIPDDARVLATLEGLRPEVMQRFNETVVDAPGLAYFSYAGVSSLSGKTTAKSEVELREHCASDDGAFRMFRHAGTRDALHPILWATAPFSFETRDASGHLVTAPSDGMVSVASAKWGEFLGCVPADHYDVIGQIGHHTRDPRTGFDAVDFYRFVAGELARRGL